MVISQCDCNVSFVETRAYHEILRKLQNKHYVIIKGNPGDGKTTLALFAIRKLIDDQNKIPLQLYDYNEWDKFVTPDKNLAIFIDNLFGEHSVSYDHVIHWSNRFPIIKANVSDRKKSNYVIICIRNDIYKQCQGMKYNRFLESAMVDVSLDKKFKLNRNEMERIFCKYVPEATHCLSQAKLSKLLENVPKLGFPQCCYLYKNIEKLQKKGLDFFLNPLQFLTEELNDRFVSKDMKMTVLVFVLLYGGKVKKDILYDSTKYTKLKETSMAMCSVDVNFPLFKIAIESVETSYVMHDVYDDMIKFAHSSVQNAIFLVVGKHDPHELIKNCDYTLLSMITTFTCPVEGIESVQVPNSCFSILRSRICELLSGNSNIANIAIQVIAQLHVWNDDMFFNKCRDCVDLFAKAVDEYGISLFVHFSAVGCLKWMKMIYNKPEVETQLQFALETACDAQNIDVVEFLLKKNVKGNIQCCFNAVRGGKMEILEALHRANVDFTKILKTATRWDVEVSILEEAALQGQCELIQPLLKLCPKLREVKSSKNTTVLHTMASAGKIEILEQLIASKTYSAFDKSSLGSTILHFACQRNQHDTVRHIIKNYPDLLLPLNYCFDAGTVLHTAAQSGNINLFKDVYRDNKAILAEHHITLFELDRGCHVLTADGQKETSVETSKLLKVRRSNGRSVLHAAAWSRSVDVFQYVAKESFDSVYEGPIAERDSILQYAKTQDYNEDMILFLEQTYFAD